MGDEISNKNIGLCIDELIQMNVKFVKEDAIKGVLMRNVVIMNLLYVDDVIFLGKTL